jgi:hypothetical protein
VQRTLNKETKKRKKDAAEEQRMAFTDKRLAVPAPPGMEFYNGNMGAVDRMDQSRQGRYALDKSLKTRVWYRKLMMGLLAFALTNAWIYWNRG